MGRDKQIKNKMHRHLYSQVMVWTKINSEESDSSFLLQFINKDATLNYDKSDPIRPV